MMKRALLYILLSLTLFATVSCGRKAEVKDIQVIPEPVFCVKKAHTFTLTNKTQVYFDNLGQNTTTAKYISKTMRKMHFHSPLLGKRESGCINFHLNDTINQEIGDEGYLLEVRTGGVYISANTEAGLFYAFQTFMQLLPDDVATVSYRRISIPECTILDYPRYTWRGSHLDVSRHFFTVKEVKRHLDLMAAYKLNKFHWHLTDDHGWRIEILKYPKLTEVGAWRPNRAGIPWGEILPAQPGETADYGGFYTQDEIRDIVSYAAMLHIDVIPEIEVPGHCSAVLAAYPQFACGEGEYQVQVGPYWPAEAVLCAGNDSVMAFLKNVVDELVTMFPYDYYHFGGDEIVKEPWEECPRCQSRMKKEHLRNEQKLEGWFMGQLENYLADQGKTLIGWDELVNAGTSTHSVILSWCGARGVMQAARHGNQVIAAPADYCYFDYYQADPAYQPAAMPHVVSLQKVYQYDPVPAGMSKSLMPKVMGGRANLSTEYIETYQQAEYMLLPRLCAFSEALWSPAEAKDWSRFRKKIEHHKQRLEAKGYICCPGSFRPTVHEAVESDSTCKVAFESEVLNTYIFYTIDGTEPTRESSIYVGPISLPKGTLLRTLSFYNGNPQEGVYDYVVGGKK